MTNADATSLPTPPRPIIAQVMAMDRQQLIGRDNALPWHIPADLAWFRRVTLGKPIIMGRHTHESIGRPLPGRCNIVVTSDPGWQRDGVEVAHSLADAIALGSEVLALTEPRPEPYELMIIGGARLCRDAMPLTDRFYLTYIDHVFEGDTWLDSFDWKDWREISREDADPADTGGYAVSYRVLDRQETVCTDADSSA